jgi:hypothetical protein
MRIWESFPWGRWAICISLWLGIWSAALATPYWTEEDYQRSLALSFGPPTFETVPPSEAPALDSYSYLFEYFQICHFLSLWQVADPGSPNYGGMIEGETGPVAQIVETDNTQEAIRVWCRYAQMTGDLELYRHNIEAAWTYTMNYPAYSEEGSDSDYYRVHNCGWALIAQMKYLDIYGDATYTQYADSCAHYLQTHLLNFNHPNPFYQRLHPLVTGWAAGALYLYGEYTSNQSYINSALQMADQVISWVEADPSRLSTTEVWAMSAGTAMWGICNSQFREDPAYGQTWLATYGSYLDTWQATGEWNNSWNVWYAHAYHYMYDITADETYHEQAVSNVDRLLAMDTDNDGGIMATATDPDTIDQTWVSCYLNWMGIAKIIDGLEDRDAGIIAVLEPDTSHPYMAGDQITVMVIAGNLGNDSLGSVPVGVSGEYSASAFANLPQGGVDTVTFSPPWIPQSNGAFPLTAYTGLIGDQDPSNDSVTINIVVLAQSAIAGRVYDSFTQEGIEATLLFYHNMYPSGEPFDSTTSDPITGNYQASVLTGEYRIVVEPVSPYTEREWSGVEVQGGDTTIFDVALIPAPTILVDDDAGGSYENWYLSPLENMGVDTYYWNVASDGSPGNALQDFRVAIWMTGSATGITLTSNDIASLVEYLDTGGNLLLTGQDLELSLEGTAFLSDYLHGEIGAYSIGNRLLNGVSGDPVSGGLSLLIAGAGGAQNQVTPGVVSAVTGGIEIYHYDSTPPASGAVRYDNGDYKSVVMTFGLEGASGVAGTNTIQDALESILMWFDPELPAPTAKSPIPQVFSLDQNYPNPFNMSTMIPFQTSQQSTVSLTIYNLLGQRVRTLLGRQETAPGIHRVVWDGLSDAGLPVSSGVYFYRLNSEQFSNSRKMVVLR